MEETDEIGVFEVFSEYGNYLVKVRFDIYIAIGRRDDLKYIKYQLNFSWKNLSLKWFLTLILIRCKKFSLKRDFKFVLKELSVL